MSAFTVPSKLSKLGGLFRRAGGAAGLSGVEGDSLRRALPVTLHPLRTLRSLREQTGLERLATAGLAAGEMEFGAFLGGLAKRGVLDPALEGDARQRAVIEAELQARQMALEHQVRMEGLRRRMGQNLARLAALAPDVYNQVAAGRRLPKDAVVIGGRPRMDLLEQLSLGMSEGSFQEADPGEELVRMLGG